MRKQLLSFAFVGLSFIQPFEATTTVPLNVVSASTALSIKEIFAPKPLAQESMDLTNRYPDKWVNEVFSDNILLTLYYLKGDTENLQISQISPIGQIVPDWQKIREPFEVSFELKPGEVFAFHDNLLPEFKDKVVQTTNSHFIWDEGFKSDGYLIGDGVCHLASLMNWAASEAGLKVTAKISHDFLPVPGIPKEYGTSIIWTPDASRNSVNQNLYIANNFSYPVKFAFKTDSTNIKLIISN